MTTTPTLQPEVTFSLFPDDFAPQVAALRDDTFVIVWDRGDSDIVGRQFDPLGSFQGGDFLAPLSSEEDRALTGPQVFQQTDGQVVVDYTLEFSPTDHDIYRSSNGFPEPNERGIEVSGGEEILLDSVARAVPFGGSAHVYEFDVGTQSNLVLRYTDAFGNEATPQIFVGPHAGEIQQDASLAALHDGHVVVAYDNVNLTTGVFNVRFHIYGSDGSAASPEVTMNAPGASTPAFPDIVELRQGVTLAAAWQQPDGIFFRLFDELGNPREAEPVLIQGSPGGFVPKIAALNDGGFLVVWTGSVFREHDGSPDLDIFFQRFDSQGHTVGDALQLNEPGDQGLLSLSVTTLHDGRVLITYNSETGDSTNVPTLAYRIVDPRDQTIFGTTIGDDTIVSRVDGAHVISSIGNDHLIGLDGNDTLDSSDGNDTLLGAGGDDSLIGGAGNDSLVGGTGSNTLDGGDGNDLLDAAAAGNDSLIGGAGIDTVSYAGAASGVSVSLFLEGAQNTGGAGTDTLSGLENLIGSHFADTLEGNDGANLIDAGDGNDRVIGNGASDTLLGGAGNDSMEGDDGNDTLDGGAGNDKLAGNDGDDTLDGGAGSDKLDGGAGTDTANYATATAGVSVSLGATGAQDTGGAGSDTLTNIENLIGSGFSDVLTGSGAANMIAGGGGNDTINAGGGSDTVFGGAGDDSISLGAGNDSYDDQSGGNDTVDGGAGNDSIQGGSGDEHFTGGDGDDVMLGMAGSDSLNGGDGNDSLLAGSGNPADTDTGSNTLLGGAGNDGLIGGDGDDLIDGGSGTDTLFYQFAHAGVVVSLATAGSQNTFGAGTDTISNVENLTGSQFADTLTGSAVANVIGGNGGDDLISGGAGNDTLEGGAGNDTLDGGAGNDLLDGGPGIDTVTYAAATSGVTVSLDVTAAQHTGGGGIDTLFDIENVIGSGFDDVLAGTAGDNVIDGGLGIDTVSYAAATAGVTVSLLLTTAQDTGGAGIDTLTNVENLTGSAFGDNFEGDGAANLFDSGDGADVLAGATGNDTILAGAGDDQVQGGGDDDSLNGGAGFDIMDGGAGNDTVDGGAGADFMTGNFGDDVYIVDNVDDHVFEFGAGDGFDRVQSSVTFTLGQFLETLTLTGTAAIDGTGNDEANAITGNAAANALSGVDGDDTLTGNAGSDTLAGGAGADHLDGGTGADTLLGGAGTDAMSGGASNDSYAFTAVADSRAGAGHDTILDFDDVGAAGGDRIDLSAIDANTHSPIDDAFAFIGTAAFSGVAGQLRVIDSGANTLIQADVNGDSRIDFEILVHDDTATAHGWTAADFVL